MLAMTMILLATPCPSDEIAPLIGKAAAGCFFAAGTLSLVAIVGGIILPHRVAVWRFLALAGGVLALFPLGFVLHVYRIDFVAEAGDGTPASGPLWKELAPPMVPVILAMAGFVGLRRIPNADSGSKSP